MSKGMKWGLGIVAVAAVGAALAAKARGGEKATEVRMETVQKRDLVASVTASGQVQPVTKVDVAADISGRIVRLAVKEGEIVKKGQFLLEIDPAQYQAAVQRAEAAVASAKASAAQAKANLIQAQRNYDRSMEIRKTNAALISEESLEQLKTAVEVNTALLESANQNADQSAASLREARSNLARTTILAPMSGKITRLAVEQGETAVPGTFNKDAATLLTIADLSVFETKVKVDETDVARISLGDSAVIQIDAFPDTTFVGKVGEGRGHLREHRTGDRLRGQDPAHEPAGGDAPRLLGDRQDRDRHAHLGADHPDHRAHRSRERGAQRRHRGGPRAGQEEGSGQEGRGRGLHRRDRQQSHLPPR
jgi:HlyD family secretion protein